jgi:hypothetical protein
MAKTGDRPLGMLGVVRLGQLGGDDAQLGRHEAQLLALQPGDDLSDQSTLNAVGLHNDKGSIHERRTVAAAHRVSDCTRGRTLGQRIVATRSCGELGQTLRPPAQPSTIH